MKKVIFLVSICLFLPFSGVGAVTSNQINATVQVLCPDAYGNWWSGSGTIIDPKGVVLTNRHVVTDQYGGIMDSCYIGLMKSINEEPDWGTEVLPNIAKVQYYTNTKDMDAAILFLSNPNNTIYPYVDIWNSNSDTLVFGDNVEVIGFPSIGGSKVTYTTGDFSGFGSKLDQTHNYIKTTAVLEHGNSGGAAYNNRIGFIGIPTMVISGKLNSISYILSINSIKNWLSGLLGQEYIQRTANTQIVVNPPKAVIPVDSTPPKMFSYREILFYGNKTKKYIDDNTHYEEDDSLTVQWSEALDSSGIEGYYVYFGQNPNVNPATEGFFTSQRSYNFEFEIPATYYFIISAKDKNGNVSQNVLKKYNYKVYSDYITNNPKAYQLMQNRPTVFNIYDYSNGEKGRLLKTVYLNSSVVQNISVPSNNVLIEWNGYYDQEFITRQSVYFDEGVWPIQCGGDVFYKIKDKISMTYEEWDACVDSHFADITSNSITKVNLKTNTAYGFRYEAYYTYEDEINVLGSFYTPFTLVATHKKAYLENSTILNRVLGYILLQVENNGEAWYLDPVTKKRYYMKDGPTAYQMMRSFGLGISNADLAKLQSGDRNLLNRLKGRIVLQVEANGEAYYINPKDSSINYLKDGQAAYQVMRFLSLGITNNDLSKIPLSEIFIK